jgi:hypothetical protein
LELEKEMLTATKLNALKIIAGTTILWIVTLHITLNLIFGKFQADTKDYGIGYLILFYTPRFTPLILTGICLIKSATNKATKQLNYLSEISVGLMIGLLAYAAVSLLLLTFPITIYINFFTWTSAAPIEYATTFLITYYLYLKKRPTQKLEALTFASLLISAAGMIYELPIFHDFTLSYYVDAAYPFYYATAFFSTIFLTIWIVGLRWHPEKYFVIATIIFAIHAIIYSASLYDRYPTELSVYTAWIPRIFGLLFLLSLLPGIKKKEAT